MVITNEQSDMGMRKRQASPLPVNYIGNEEDGRRILEGRKEGSGSGVGLLGLGSKWVRFGHVDF